MDDQKFLYDTFNIYYSKGMEAKKSGNAALSKRNLLLASETLLKMAMASKGELKRARVERANRLYEMANNITAESLQEEKKAEEKKQQSKASSKTADGGGNGKDKDDESETVWSAAEVPGIRFADVAGLEDVKSSINLRIILPMKYPEVYKKYNKKMGGGILLYGPPGTGKTMIAKAIATEVGAKFYSVKCSDIVSKWFGEAEKNVKNLFNTARNDERAIIFFDEFDALGAKRGGNSTVMNRLVPELLSQIQGFSETDSTLLLLAATNRPWDIDSAMLRPGRFNELIYISLPDAPARKFMIEKALKGVPIANDVSMDWLVELTEGFNGADVVEFCDRAKDDPVFRTIQGGGAEVSSITREDILNTAEKVKGSVQEADMKAFEKFMNQRI